MLHATAPYASCHSSSCFMPQAPCFMPQLLILHATAPHATCHSSSAATWKSGVPESDALANVLHGLELPSNRSLSSHTAKWPLPPTPRPSCVENCVHKEWGRMGVGPSCLANCVQRGVGGSSSGPFACECAHHADARVCVWGGAGSRRRKQGSTAVWGRYQRKATIRCCAGPGAEEGSEDPLRIVWLLRLTMHTAQAQTTTPGSSRSGHP